ncbi:MAG: hypothetical protein GC193_10510 [Cryomorphaceae bacterium]|nr:hypothetical protein [Cryomorphaceae bacterium]
MKFEIDIIPIQLLFLVFGLSCLSCSDVKVIEEDGWRKVFQNDILVDCAQIKNGRLNGKRYQFYSDGERRSLSFYKNDTLDGDFFEKLPDKTSLKTFYQNGKKQGSQLLLDSSGNLKSYSYFIDDSLRFNCNYADSSRIISSKGSSCLGVYYENEFHVGDTLYMNIYIVPIPKVRIKFLKEDEKYGYLYKLFEPKSHPLVEYEVLNNAGKFKTYYFLQIFDKSSNDLIDKFKFFIEYTVYE